MRYMIYSVLIFSFLMIDCDLNAQKIDSTYNDSTSDSLNANTVEKEENSEEFYVSKKRKALYDIRKLRENGLVVILRTSSSRLEKLRFLSRNQQLSEVQRQILQSRVQEIEQENEIINQSLIKAFSANYYFSDVHFIYDSSLTQLKNGVQQGIFVNKNGKIDTSIELNTEDYFICNYTLASKSKEIEGLVIYNSKMEKVKEPFPGVAVSGSSGLNMLLQLFTDDKKYLERKIIKDAEKLQRNLSTF